MTQTRDEYVAGLRELAARLERHPEAPLPHDGHGYSSILVFVRSPEEFAEAARCYGGVKHHGDKGIELRDGVPGLRIRVCPLEDTVCERVEVGTRTEVAYEVPEDVKEQYRVEREVPVYETRCPDSVLNPPELAHSDGLTLVTDD